MSDDLPPIKRKLNSVKKSDPSTITQQEEGEKKVTRTHETTASLVKDFFTNNRVQAGILITVLGVMLFLAGHFIDWALSLGFLVTSPFLFMAFRYARKKDYVVIFELPPDSLKLKLHWCRPWFFDECTATDMEAHLMAGNTPVYICQHFKPDERKIKFGWIKGKTPIEFSVDLKHYASLSNSMQRYLKWIREGALDAERIGAEYGVFNTERLTEYDKGDIPENSMDFPDRPPSERKDLGVDRSG